MTCIPARRRHDRYHATALWAGMNLANGLGIAHFQARATRFTDYAKRFHGNDGDSWRISPSRQFFMGQTTVRRSRASSYRTKPHSNSAR